MTNKEKFKEVFGRGNVNTDECPIYCSITDGDECPYYDSTSNVCSPGYWWNAEYKETTTKNGLGVDCIDKWDIGGKEAEAWIVKGKLQIRHRGTIHNIDLPSVTPQEPILDKIRAEILNEIHHILDGEPIIELKEVLQILDKYKTDKEQENDNT